jgi:hypothetical protein
VVQAVVEHAQHQEADDGIGDTAAAAERAGAAAANVRSVEGARLESVDGAKAPRRLKPTSQRGPATVRSTRLLYMQLRLDQTARKEHNDN